VEPELSPRQQRLWPHVTAALDGHTDLAHDAEHVLRVFRWAVHLARAEGVDTDLAGAAALVHDLVNVPKESPGRASGSQRSADASAAILPLAGYTAAESSAIIEAVRTCSWSRGLAPTSALGAVLQDADRLDAIGAIGVARNLMCAQGMASRGTGGQLYHPDDPLAEGDRAPDDIRYAIDHYTVKLLTLADGMHTPAARQEAARRHRFMLTFLEQLCREVRRPGPAAA
jgi:uncharacterized protein